MGNPLDNETENPRRFVGDMVTRLIHRTDSEDPGCAIDLDDQERAKKLVYSDSLEQLQAQEWSVFAQYQGAFLEGETPEMYNLPADAVTRRRFKETKATFRPCPLCRPDEKKEADDGAAQE